MGNSRTVCIQTEDRAVCCVKATRRDKMLKILSKIQIYELKTPILLLSEYI